MKTFELSAIESRANKLFREHNLPKPTTLEKIYKRRHYDCRALYIALEDPDLMSDDLSEDVMEELTELYSNQEYYCSESFDEFSTKVNVYDAMRDIAIELSETFPNLIFSVGRESYEYDDPNCKLYEGYCDAAYINGVEICGVTDDDIEL